MQGARLLHRTLLFLALLVMGLPIVQADLGGVHVPVTGPVDAGTVIAVRPAPADALGFRLPHDLTRAVHAEDDLVFARPAAAPQEEGGLHFDCPEAIGPRIDDEEVIVVYGCPIFVADDGDLFGNMELAVNPRNPRQVALFTLHGGPAVNGPHHYSRNQMAHTAFVSYDEGVSWADNPLSPADATVNAALGASATGVMDKDGRIYIGYLWTDRTTNGHRSEIGLFKAGTPDRPYDARESYRAPALFHTRDPDNLVSDIHLVHLRAPHAYQPRDIANDTADPDHPVAADDSPPTDERVFLVWHESTLNATASKTGLSGWIDHGWTTTAAANDWVRIEPELVIGPCKDASNAVSWDGRVYVACVVDRGYKHRERALVGDIDLWAIDPKTSEAELVDTTTIHGDDPVLAVNSDGYFVVAAHEFKGEHEIHVRLAFSQGGTRWYTRPPDLGGELHRFVGARPALDARITAMAVSDLERTVVFVYKERHNMTGAEGNATAAATDDDPQPYSRALIALNECELLGGAVFQLGTGERVFEETNPEVTFNSRDGTGIPEHAFDDIKDALTYVRWPDGLERIHFAVNDNGGALYGRIIVERVASACTIPNFPALPEVVPVPQAVPLGQMTSNVIGAGAGVFSAAMIGYLLTVKRRTANYVTAEAK